MEAVCIYKDGNDRYNTQLFKLLKDKEHDLINLQKLIEATTNHFDEGSIYKETPNLIRLLIREDHNCAKFCIIDYLKIFIIVLLCSLVNIRWRQSLYMY